MTYNYLDAFALATEERPGEISPFERPQSNLNRAIKYAPGGQDKSLLPDHGAA